jgi:hypothetical protein
MRPRRLAHRGTVVATGFVIDSSLVGAAETRRRVLALWVPGASVREREGDFVITGLRASRVRVSTAPGTPLVAQQGLLATLPLDPDEIAELGVPGAIVIARSGLAELFRMAEAREVDLASWIDLDDFQVAEVKPLAAPPVRAAIPPPPVTDIRTVTGAPAADAQVEEVTAALMRARSGPAARNEAPSLWSRFVGWLSQRLAPRRKALPASTSSRPPKLSWFDRLRSRMAEALWKSRLGRALGRRHAEYLRRVLEMFDRGDIEDALRHAIPLGGQGGEARLGVGVPRPRRSLSLTFGARRTSSIIPVADVAMAMMRERYRAAAARLEQSGRIEEAAFVFAELLADPMAAIALLERHGRYVVAARLAEGRGLEPGLIVRLWFLAGDRERAIDTARKHRAWADAVARLEKSGDSRAAVLRMLWADHLADTGDFVQAVEAAWPVKPSRALVEAWIDRGIALEGTAAARLFVKKLVVAPSTFPTVAPAILSILGAPDEDFVRQRVAMVEELVRSPTSAELQTIARPALRALLRDCGVGAEEATTDLVERLIKFADDAALRADRPPVPVARRRLSLVDRGSPVELVWSAHDAGAVPVHDAAVLPGDRLLLALGELGVRILGRNGRTIAQIDQPATRLVVADHGGRALAIASRGNVRRIARLDLVERRGAYWCDAEVHDCASTFDGDLWIATRGSEVFAVDTTASRWRAVWGVEVEPRGARCSVRRDGHWFVVGVHAGEELEHWHYEGFTLRARKPWPRNGTEYVVVPPKMNALPFVVRDPEDATASDVATISSVQIGSDLAIVNRWTDAGPSITCTHLKVHRMLASLRLDGATAANLRLADGLLTIGDDRGRVIVFDVDRGVIRRDLRTS